MGRIVEQLCEPTSKTQCRRTIRKFYYVSQSSHPSVQRDRSRGPQTFSDKPWRKLPVYMQRPRHSVWEDFWHRGPHRHMEKWMEANSMKMKKMDKMFDKMFDEVTPPLARRGFTARRDVEVKYEDGLYEVKLPVKDFAPEDLTVKIAENRLTVSGKFESKLDNNGVVYQEFTRQFNIPKDVKMESMESVMTEDGHLIVRGQLEAPEIPKETPIKIQVEKPTDVKTD